jgi:hypothetical protein
VIYFALCGLEAGIFLALLSLYRAANRPDLGSFLLSTPGVALLCASIIIVLSMGWAIRILRKCPPAHKRRTYMEIIMNLVMLVLFLGTAEVLAHLLSKHTAAGETVLGVVLYPKDWSTSASYYKKVIDRLVREGSHNTYDQLLGWTLTPSRSDTTAQYLSSVEGLRSPRVGMSFADPHTRHSGFSTKPAAVRIALIGDSFTYGAEVRCEESWGHLLEELLPPHVQVLNFAIGAYGLNQALLRYEKDTRLWKPQIVIIGINSVMIQRINNIYPFLKDPEWGFPLARPRLIMKNNIPTTVNYPIPEPKEIFVHTTVSDLPYLNLDDYYRPFEWERGGFWSLLERSYVFRLAYSFRPPGDGRQEERDQKAMELSQFVIPHLVREVSEDGAVPLVVYLPQKGEIGVSSEPQNKAIPLSARLLHNVGIEYFDPTACLTEVSLSDAYMKGNHYSPQANAQIARCLEPVLREMVTRFSEQPLSHLH